MTSVLANSFAEHYKEYIIHRVVEYLSLKHLDCPNPPLYSAHMWVLYPTSTHWAAVAVPASAGWERPGVGSAGYDTTVNTEGNWKRFTWMHLADTFAFKVYIYQFMHFLRIKPVSLELGALTYYCLSYRNAITHYKYNNGHTNTCINILY